MLCNTELWYRCICQVHHVNFEIVQLFIHIIRNIAEAETGLSLFFFTILLLLLLFNAFCCCLTLFVVAVTAVTAFGVFLLLHSSSSGWKYGDSIIIIQ